MRLAIAGLLLVISAWPASAGSHLYGTGSNPNDHYVHSYVTRSGVFHQGHYQTNPNGTQLDNYGTLGNVNPHTGAVGTHIPKD
jgi:hypothetical protein